MAIPPLWVFSYEGVQGRDRGQNAPEHLHGSTLARRALFMNQCDLANTPHPGFDLNLSPLVTLHHFNLLSLRTVWLPGNREDILKLLPLRP